MKKVCERHQSLFKEEKEKKQQYGHEQYKNLPEDDTKLVEYWKIYYKMRKSVLL